MIDFIKILAAYLVRQIVFVVSIDVAEKRTRLIDVAEVFLRQMFADAVASVKLLVIEDRQPNISAARAAPITVKAQKESVRLSSRSPCPTASRSQTNAPRHTTPPEQKIFRRAPRSHSR